MRMLSQPHLRLAATCLVAFPLAACAPAGLAPLPPSVVPAAPAAAAAAPAEDGDHTVRFGLALPGGAAARKLLYVANEIESLDIDLYWLDGATPRLVQTKSLTAAEVAEGPSIGFSKLKRDRNYRVIATAWRTIAGTKTPISDDATSRLGFSIGHAEDQQATIVGDLPVVLLDTPAPEYEAGASIAVTPGTTRHAALAGTTLANDVVAATLTFDGTRAKVSWTSRGAGAVDYDVAIAPTGAPTNVLVAATGTDREAGTAHLRTFELGTAPLGTYQATVSVKGGTGTSFSATGELKRAVAAVAITYVDQKARVAWSSLGAGEADYDVVVEDGSGTVVFRDDAIDVRTGTSHFKRFDLGSTPFGSYTAKVRLKDRPTSERASDATAFTNTIPGVTHLYDGTDAKISWNSHVALATDYVLDVLDGGGAVVATKDVLAQTGTYNTVAVPMGAAASGSYKARVTVKDVASTAKSSTAKAYTAPTTAPEPTGGSGFIIASNAAGNRPYFSLDFTGVGAGATEYTFKVYRAAIPGSPSVADAPYKTYTKTLTGTVLNYARYLDHASDTYDPNHNYQIEVYVGTTLISTSEVSPYIVGADPIIGNCTVVPDPDCEFVAPTPPGVID